jgi:hypothetical protein
MLKQLLPALGQTLLGDEMGKVKKLFELKCADGCEVSALLLYDSSLSEAVVKFTIHGAAAEDVVGERIGEEVRAALEAEGAQPLEATEAV